MTHLRLRGCFHPLTEIFEQLSCQGNKQQLLVALQPSLKTDAKLAKYCNATLQLLKKVQDKLRATKGSKVEPGARLHGVRRLSDLKRKCDSQAELIDPEAERAIEDLRDYLRDLQVKLWIERGDYDRCIQERWRHLTGDPNPSDTVKNKFVTRCNVFQCHQLLDIANCHLKHGQESTTHDKMENNVPGLEESCTIAHTLLDQVERRLKELKEQRNPPPQPTRVGDLHEAQLRLLHLRAECQLARVSVFSHDRGFTGNLDQWVPRATTLNDAAQTVTEGLKVIRTQDPRTYQQPRSVVIDPTKDGALYLQYRAVFHLLRGRLDWLLVKKSETESAFERAFWDFEMARGGLGEHNSLLSALIDLYAAEACLARARAGLYDTKNFEGAVSLARAKYESARGALQRAREALLASRRNAIWWKFFFQLVSQYHADRLLLGYTQLTMDENEVVGAIKEAKSIRKALERERRTHEIDAPVRPWCEKLQDFLLRLGRAYQGLRSALDFYLPELAPQRRWIRRMWWELTLCSYATGLLALRVLSPEMPELERPKHIMWQLRWLNQSAGLDVRSGLQTEVETLENNTFPQKAFAEKVLSEPAGREQWVALIDLAERHAVMPPAVD